MVRQVRKLTQKRRSGRQYLLSYMEKNYLMKQVDHGKTSLKLCDGFGIEFESRGAHGCEEQWNMRV
jgi:hypothetical protein